MVLYDMNDFGGLEEYASALAVGVKQKGHTLMVLSCAWVSPQNQYLSRFDQNGIPFMRVPKWVSLPASDWLTKTKILSLLLWVLSPLILLLGVGVSLVKKRSWRQSVISAKGWLGGKLLKRFIGPDWRKPIVRMLLRWIRIRWRPDLFHLQGYTSNLLFVIDWASSNHIPIVYEEHQTPDSQFDWWKGFGQTINKADIVVAVSEKSADSLRDVCGVSQPIRVRSPLLVDPFPLGIPEEFRANHDDNPLNITTVARLYVTKGLNYLLEAIREVQKYHPAVKFRVYGDGPLRQDLLTYAQELGIDGNNIFVGSFHSREELTEIMANTGIYVMSSVLEGQPLALVEAMAYGCSIVTTKVGGIPELIQDGVNGLLCEPADPLGLARKICMLIEDPDLRYKLGRTARISYEQSPFQPLSVSSQLISIYDEVLKR